jgi:hypothetical protein
MAVGATIWTVGRAQRSPRSRPAPGGPGGGPPPRRPAQENPFGWEEPPGPPSPGRRPDDIEGTGQEVSDEDELPPGREPFGG